MPGELSGKVAVVTGAANGLGRAFAHELTARGATVIPIDIETDVTSRAALTALAATTQRVDLLINNAAISISAPFEQTDPDAFDRLINVNFIGVVNATRAFLPILTRPGGQILNVSSCFAWIGYPGKTAYAASKAAVRAFSESLRLDLAPRGIGVTALYPAAVRTGIVERGISASSEAKLREARFLADRGLDPEIVARRALDKLRDNPARIVIGRDYRLIDLVTRLSPALASRIVARAAARNGF